MNTRRRCRDSGVSAGVAAPVACALAAAATLLFTPAASADPTYRIVDLTELAEPLGVIQSEARAVNEAGEIVGFELVEAFIERGLYWDAAGNPQLLDGLPGDNSNSAVGIGEDGTILGQSELVTFEYQGHILIIHEDQKASFWSNGQLVNINDLVTSGGELVTLHRAWDMNTAGQIVGWAGLNAGPPFFSNGFLFDAGVVTDLGELQRPVAVNEHGQIVGYNKDGQDNAYLWDNGQLTNLHDHPSLTGVTSRAWGINDAAMIVGEAQFLLSRPEEPTLWLNGTPIRLVPEFNRPQGVALAVNDHGEVVGYFNDLDQIGSPWRGFIWKNGERTDLLDLIPPGEGWEVLFPSDINDRGQIVGGARRNGVLGRAFIMTPIPPCPPDVNGDGVVDVLDLLEVLSSWGPYAPCPPIMSADVNGDCTVDVLDLLEVLSSWGACV